MNGIEKGGGSTLSLQHQIRVLHVFYGNNIAGGGSYSMLYLCRGLASHYKTEPLAIVPITPEREMSNALNRCGIKTYDLKVPWLVHGTSWKGELAAPIRKLANPFNRRATDDAIREILEKKRIDILHIGGAVIDVGFRPARELGVPIVWHLREFVERDHALRYFNKRRALEEYSQAACCIAVSNAVAHHYRAMLGNVPIKVVYNGMMPEKELDERRMLARGDRAKDGIWKMAFFGGLREEKGCFELIRALGLLRNGTNIRFHLDVYGRSTVSELARFENAVKANGLAGKVEYKGWAKLTPTIISAYDIAFTCSRSEAFGRVTADAMCNGVLVIGANSGGTSELLSNRRGVLYKSGDHASLAKAIGDVTEGRVDYGATIRRAQQFALHNFSIERYVTSIVDVYQEILG